MATGRQRTLHGATSGENVRRLQVALQNIGYEPGHIDGVYGPATARAVRSFQESAGLPADGIVGPQTWDELARRSGGDDLIGQKLTGTLHGATGGPDVRRAQELLLKAGFDPDTIDGIYGWHTARAVGSFQKSRGIRITRVVDAETWRMLTEQPGRRSKTVTILFSDIFDLTPLGARLDPESLRRVMAHYFAEMRTPLEAHGGTVEKFIGDAIMAVFGASAPHEDHALRAVRAASAMRERLAALNDDLRRTDDVELQMSIAINTGEVSSSTSTEGPASVSGDAVTVAARLEQAAPPGEILLGEATYRLVAGEVAAERFEPVIVKGRKEPIEAYRLIGVESEPPGPRSWLPGFNADSTEGADLLGIQKRVDFLASVLAAKQLDTPLAIGLFGDWGSGKSFFMHRLQKRIAEVTEESARAEAKGESSYYCSYVRQVPFNAWLYSDSDIIWPSLAVRVFQSVTGAEQEAPHGEFQDEALSKYQARTQASLRGLDEERREAESEEAALDSRIADLTREIGEKRARAAEREADLGPQAQALAGSVLLLPRLRRLARELSLTDWLVIGAVVAGAVAIGVVAVALPAWATAVVAVAGIAVALLTKALPYTALQLEIERLETRRKTLQEKRQSTTEKEPNEEQRAALRARPLLPDFAQDQASRWAGLEQRGVITEIRFAFERLSGLISESLRARAEGPGAEADMAPVDRVIVYVDDLDRCQADVVVRVLEAMKLLLNLPNFVVVVGVDSRWLFRSLEINFQKVMETGDGWQATPQNYLEKIFQYSLVLPPISEEGFRRLVHSLLPIEAIAPPDEARPHPEAADEADLIEPPAAEEPPVATEEAVPPPPGVAASARETHTVTGPAIDLTPGDLAATPQELEFIESLAPFFETPRAVKRLTNVYRLIRVSVGADRVLHRAAYEPILLLLSIAIGYPGLAREFFRELHQWQDMHMAPWSDFAKETGSLRPLLSERGLGSARLGDRLVGDFLEWVPVVAEFSFHPWRDLMTSAPPSDAS
jgi:class 3 adenylate cyclase